MLNERLKDHGSYFGALPVHNGKRDLYSGYLDPSRRLFFFLAVLLNNVYFIQTFNDNF